MSEYSYNDIIMDPEDPRLEGAIGKECYFSDCPTKLLESARYNSASYLDCLTNISKEKACPFSDKNGSGWALIIIKKEEPKPKPKYVPFESIEEFLTAYFKSVANSECIQKTISSTGIWLKHNDAFLLVVEIWDRGVVIGDINMQTTEIDEDEYLTVHGVTKWKELLEDYTFLDGTTCGKLAEEKKWQ